MLKLLMILLVVKYTFSLKKHDHNRFEKLIADTSYSSTNQLEIKKNIFIIINRVTHIGIKNTCDTRIIQSDVLAKMRNLKSIISLCNGYCRLAMNPEGQVYGSKEFNLDTIWSRIDLTDEVILSPLLGAHYIKFVLADKYLCINNDGQLFASNTKSQSCLWFSRFPKLTSAYSNLNIVIEKNCIISVISDDEYSSDEQCPNKLNTTSGYSPDISKFIRTCQASLVKNEPLSHTTQSNLKIFMHQPTKSAVITKKTFEDDPLNLNSDVLSALNAEMIEKAKILCKEYLLDELIYEKLTNFDYLHVESSSLAKIPKLCIDYIEYLKQTKKKEEKNQIEYILNYDEAESKAKNIKKCYQFRDTPMYEKCIEKNFKCYAYNNDPEKLKKCRKKNGIKVPKKNPTF